MTKVYYVIVTQSDKYLVFNQCHRTDIDILSISDLCCATFFDSKEKANNTIKELYGEVETQWDYSQKYSSGTLRVGKVVMNYYEIIEGHRE